MRKESNPNMNFTDLLIKHCYPVSLWKWYAAKEWPEHFLWTNPAPYLQSTQFVWLVQKLWKIWEQETPQLEEGNAEETLWREIRKICKQT